MKERGAPLCVWKQWKVEASLVKVGSGDPRGSFLAGQGGCPNEMRNNTSLQFWMNYNTDVQVFTCRHFGDSQLKIHLKATEQPKMCWHEGKWEKILSKYCKMAHCRCTGWAVRWALPETTCGEKISGNTYWDEPENTVCSDICDIISAWNFVVTPVRTTGPSL